MWLQVIVMTFMAAVLIVSAGPISQSLSSLYLAVDTPVSGSGEGSPDASIAALTDTSATADGSGLVVAPPPSQPRTWVAASRMVAFAASLAMVESERAARAAADEAGR